MPPSSRIVFAACAQMLTQVLKLERRDMPVAAAGCVLIQVAARSPSCSLPKWRRNLSIFILLHLILLHLHPPSFHLQHAGGQRFQEAGMHRLWRRSRHQLQVRNLSSAHLPTALPLIHIYWLLERKTGWRRRCASPTAGAATFSSTWCRNSVHRMET